jgi:glucose-1-phosphate thymidylyltransferase
MILAGGFAKRMWPLTMDFPKALLPVAGKPMVDHIIERVEGIDDIDKIFISTNERFGDIFKKWMDGHKSEKIASKLSLIVEPATKEEEKFGSVRAIEYFIKQNKIKDDVLIIGGDNLFSFEMNDLLDFSEKKKAPTVAFFDVGDISEARKMGICMLDNNAKIIDFEEKPHEPRSTLASTCIYHIPKNRLGMVSEYIKDKNNPDAPGHFINWMRKKIPVYGFVSKKKWYDIGSQETYKQADRELRNRDG